MKGELLLSITTPNKTDDLRAKEIRKCLNTLHLLGSVPLSVFVPQPLPRDGTAESNLTSHDELNRYFKIVHISLYTLYS
jgi:hypothetical protein